MVTVHSRPADRFVISVVEVVYRVCGRIDLWATLACKIVVPPDTEKIKLLMHKELK